MQPNAFTIQKYLHAAKCPLINWQMDYWLNSTFLLAQEVGAHNPMVNHRPFLGAMHAIHFLFFPLLARSEPLPCLHIDLFADGNSGSIVQEFVQLVGKLCACQCPFQL
jgi:hypothetical protein